MSGAFSDFLLDFGRLFRYDDTGIALSNDSLLLTPPNLASMPKDGSAVSGHSDDYGLSFHIRFEINSLTLAATPLVCVGFEPPFDTALALKDKVQRAIPLKMRLYDHDDYALSLLYLDVPPVVNVQFTAEGQSDPADVTNELVPISKAYSGNTDLRQ